MSDCLFTLRSFAHLSFYRADRSDKLRLNQKTGTALYQSVPLLQSVAAIKVLLSHLGVINNHGVDVLALGNYV
jgi:hypothetical protein